MNYFRKGLAVFLLLALCLVTVLPAMAAQPEAGTSGAAAETPKPEKQEQKTTQITASVAAAAPSYFVTIPESLELGSLDPARDFEKSYTVSAEVAGGTVTVTAREQAFSLTSGVHALSAFNRFGQDGTHVFHASGSCTGLVTIDREQIAAAAPGVYTGTLHFDICYKPGSLPPAPVDPDVPDPDETGEPGGATEPDGTDEPVIPPAAGTKYYTAEATMLHESKEAPSMCDGFFHRYADVAVKNGQATLTLYCIDPIPNFPISDAPVKNIRLHYEDRDYTVTLDQSTKVMKHFEKKESFINEAGDYPAAIVTVILPEAALDQARDRGLDVTAFVNVVMNIDVAFRLRLGELKAVEKPEEDKPAPPTPPKDPDGPAKPHKPDNTGPTTPLTPPPADGLTDGSYTASVSMRNETDFNKASMCDPLFYQKADITVRGDTATVKLYVIDPVPAFPEEGTPVSNMSFRYQGQSYPASVNSGSKVTRNFPARAGFIEPGGNYRATPITFSIPTSAIADSADKALMCRSYVNAVMHRDVDFYVVFGNLTGGSTSGPGPSTGGGNAPSGLSMADGQYNAAVSMRKMGHFNDPSMCNPLFFPRADITVKGADAELTFYVIDPIPQFDSPENRPPVKNPRLHYEGREYPAAFTQGGTETRHFEAAPGFIEQAGDYSFGTVRVTVPVKALEDSLKEKLTCTAFVNAVMKTDVEFYVVLDDIQEGPIPEADAAMEAPDDGDIFDWELDDTGDIFCYESDVSMRRADDFQKESMCSPLFYEKAHILFGGDTAELTLYIIDPVPKFADEGTPLSDVVFLYKENRYLGKPQTGAKVDREFPEVPGFIPQAGTYSTTPVKVVLPASAIADSLTGGLKCEAYVNTVMHTTQQFHVVLDNLKELPAPASEADGPIRIDTGMLPAVIGISLALLAVLGWAGAGILRRRR